MYKIAVIGAGQLGSRHLQGLKLSKLKSDIWVVDNNPNSLQIAQQISLFFCKVLAGVYYKGEDTLNKVVTFYVTECRSFAIIRKFYYSM